MEQQFNIGDLTLLNVLNYHRVDADLQGVSKAIFNFSNMNKVEPLAMLLFSSRMRSMRKKYPLVPFIALGFENNSYAAHMGLFESFGLNYGKQPGEARGSHTYIPLTNINVTQLKKESYDTDQGIVQKVIERKALEMARILCGSNDDILNSIYQCLREILRNIVEHSDSDDIWVAAQLWAHEIEIGILDEGVGISQALGFNPYLNFPEKHSALTLSLQPAISGKAFVYGGLERGKLEGGWDHSGFGLYIASQISKKNGDFFICSGNSSLWLNEYGVAVNDYNHHGTAIRIRVDLNKLSSFNQTHITKIISDGEEIAQQKYSAFALTKASAASKKSLQPK